MEGGDRAEEIRVLAAQFIDGFIAAADKTSFLRLAGVPFERADGSGGRALKLVDVKLETEWQMGAASPAFGTRELNYLPFPGEMVKPRTNMRFVYVSLDERREVDLRDFLAARPESGA
jgi:hypothetical protein